MERVRRVRALATRPYPRIGAAEGDSCGRACRSYWLRATIFAPCRSSSGTATFADEERSADEARLITVGYSARGRLLVVAHTERGESVRIIGARRATARERKRHEA
jgi:Ribonuclease toxin, BrnT, of type II toxin-antitoxin system